MRPGATEDYLRYELTKIGGAAAKPMVVIEVTNGHDPHGKMVVRAIVDSGADFTCCSRDFANQISHVFDRGAAAELEGISGKVKAYRHKMIVRLVGPNVDPDKVQDEDLIPGSFTLMGIVCDSNTPVVLGCHDFLRSWDFRLTVAENAFYLVPSDKELRKSVKRWLLKRWTARTAPIFKASPPAVEPQPHPEPPQACP